MSIKGTRLHSILPKHHPGGRLSYGLCVVEVKNIIGKTVQPIYNIIHT